MFSFTEEIFTQFKCKIDENESHIIYELDKNYDICFEDGIINVTSGIISVLFYDNKMMYSMTLKPDEEIYFMEFIKKSELESQIIKDEYTELDYTFEKQIKLIELERKIRKDKIKMLNL